MNYTGYSVENFICDESFNNYYYNRNAEDVVFWENWIKNHPEKKYEIDAAKEIIDQMSMSLPEEEFLKERSEIYKFINTSRKVGENHSLRSQKYQYRKLAAALLILISFGIGYFLIRNPQSNGDQKENSLTALIEKVNPKGEKSTMFLDDGSKIILNSESSLKFKHNFDENTREITLTGEAFFEVAKDSLRPFIVNVQDLAITALGTSFNVKAFEDDEMSSVSLVTGKVRVQDNTEHSQAVFLSAGEGAYYNTTVNSLTKKRFNSKQVLAWKNGVLYFQEASLDEILMDLERWYGTEFEVINRREKESGYTGEFKNESLENILESLSFAKNFTYQIDKRKVKINFSTN